jgi:hypothetical protein
MSLFIGMKIIISESDKNEILKMYGLLTEQSETEMFPNGEKAYHLTPDIYLNSIKREGLKPKSESKLSSHPDRIYMYLNPDSSYNTLAGTLWNSSRNKSQIKNYYVLEIDTSQLPEHRYYLDTASSLSYAAIYTTQSIPPSAIKVVKKIPVEELPKPQPETPIEPWVVYSSEYDDSELGNNWEALLRRYEETK